MRLLGCGRTTQQEKPVPAVQPQTHKKPLKEHIKELKTDVAAVAKRVLNPDSPEEQAGAVGIKVMLGVYVIMGVMAAWTFAVRRINGFYNPS